MGESSPGMKRGLVGVAPMFKVTNKHFRFLARRLSPHCDLYTEMYVDRILTRGSRPVPDVIGGFPGEEGTTVQLAGSCPQELYQATKMCADYGYQRINLNCGCPSEKGIDNFGVSLMKDPGLVGSLAAAMMDAVQGRSVEISIKCRNGVDDVHSYEELQHFIQCCADSGIRRFIIHSRIAILGLKTGKNHTVPPINYEYAYRLIQDFPDVEFIINGEITRPDQIETHLERGAVGVMIGRPFRQDLWLLRQLDEHFYGPSEKMEITDVLSDYQDYLLQEIDRAQQSGGSGIRASGYYLMLPAQALLSGIAHGKTCRRILGESSVPIEDRIPQVIDVIQSKKYDSENDLE